MNKVCVRCKKELTGFIQPNKTYCDGCMFIRRKELHAINSKKRIYKNKLKKFYSYQRIPLIQSPYLIELKQLMKCLPLEIREKNR